MDGIWLFLAEYKIYILIGILLVIAVLGWRFVDKIQRVSYGEFVIDRKVD